MVEKQIEEARKVSDSLLEQAIDITVKLDPSKKYILYAEDEMFMRSYFHAFMARQGITNIILSENINQTISTLLTLNGKSKDLITCIITDLDFGKSGGNVNDLIKLAKEKDIPVFVLSGMKSFENYIDPALFEYVIPFKKHEANSVLKIANLIKEYHSYLNC